MSDSNCTGNEGKISGGCYCGAIRYEADEPPLEGVGICHCRECQRWTGSAYCPAVGFPLSGFRYTKGTPKLNHTSSILERGFCPDCGSSLHSRYKVNLGGDYAADSPDHLYISIGTLDNPEIPEVAFHYGVESRLSWVHFNDNVPQIRCDEDPDLIKALSSVDKKES